MRLFWRSIIYYGELKTTKSTVYITSKESKIDNIFPFICSNRYNDPDLPANEADDEDIPISSSGNDKKYLIIVKGTANNGNALINPQINIILNNIIISW